MSESYIVVVSHHKSLSRIRLFCAVTPRGEEDKEEEEEEGEERIIFVARFVIVFANYNFSSLSLSLCLSFFVRAHVKIFFFCENEKLRRFLPPKIWTPRRTRRLWISLTKRMMTTKNKKRNASEKSRGFHRDWNGIKGQSSMQFNYSE